MLELIFQGLIEWLYGLILEAWEYFFSVFTDVLNVDFDYLKVHIPVIPDIVEILMAVGWALLIGNLVFQATKSMMTGLGFEGEDPKSLFTRTFVFAFLLVASPQICEIGLSMTAKIITLLDAVDAVDVNLLGEGSFGGLAAEWLLIIVINIILMFKVLRLLLEIVERYLVLAFLTMCAPLAFGMGGSKNTSDIFTGWCRMFASMCFVMASNMIFFKLLLSLLGNVPTGVDVLVWIALVFGVVKVARKVDSIITRIGLNPALTGDGLGGHSLPGMLAYTVVRSMASNVVKSAGKSAGGAQGSSGSGSGAKVGGGKPNFKSPAGAGTSAGASGGAGSSGKSGAGKGDSGPKGAGGSGSAQQNTATHTQTAQPGAAQNGGQRWAPAGQPVDVAPDDAEAAAMEGGAPITYASAQTQPSDTGASQERRSSVPPGTVRSPSHVKQGGGAKVKGVNTNNVKNSSANSSRNTSVRPGQALPGAAAYGTDTNAGKNGAAGTGGTSGMRTGLGSGGAPRPGMAETGTPSNVRMAADKSGTSQPGTAGTGAAAETRSVTGKGVMPQPGLAGANSPVRDKAGASQPGTAGTAETSGTRKTSVDEKTSRPGIAGTGAGSKNRTAAIRGMASRPGTAGTGASGGKAPGEGKAPRPGTAGTGGGSSEQTVHGGAQAPANGTAGAGTQTATRFTNAPRMAQNQAVQNSVQAAQQSAVTLEGAKQAPAGGAGKTPPPTAPDSGAPASGKDSRFTQRPAAVQPAQSGIGSQSGAAGTAPTAQSAQPGQTAKESQRMVGAPNGAPVPTLGQASNPAPQESRVTHPGGTGSGARQPSRASARQESRAQRPKSAPGDASRAARPSGAGDGGKRGASTTASARQERRAAAMNKTPSGIKGVASVQHPGTAGTAPPAARPSRKGQDETRPSKPEDAAPGVKEEPTAADAAPAETEKGDGGNE